MAREINLVPDIKGEMIKALKVRNYIFFASIVVAIASVVLTVVIGLIAGGQQLVRDSKKETINQLSSKLNSYSELNDVLTIKDQVGNLAALSSNKNVVSRTFNAISALIPTGADTITISELSVNLSGSQPTLTFEAQANAGQEPYIDYNVLDSFKKSMDYMRYDYGNYVDKEGNQIPSYCIIEQGTDGATLKDSTKGYYAYWTINGEGCNPSETLKATDYSVETYDNQSVVRIWRTPQYSDWYKETASTTQPSMTLDGTISNVEHFVSQCISYTGDNSKDKSNPTWSEENNCHLVQDASGDTNGIKISDSSNGRDSSNGLVLRFSASVYINPEFYSFTNKHVLAIAPSGRRNVTDSYVQIQSIFGKRASDCDQSDTACNSNSTNGAGENNG